MTALRLAVLTPSYAPDVELFTILHESVMLHTQPGTLHHVVVPDRDHDMFAELNSGRLIVHRASTLIPRRFLAVPRANTWINARCPWPPVRGWVMQQVLKLAAAAAMEVDVVMLADSDVCLTRQLAEQDLVRQGRVRHYRVEGAVHDAMPRHLLWHKVTRRLLRLPSPPPPPLPDYVAPLAAWRPDDIRKMLEHVERVGGSAWQDLIGRELHFSEFILQGVYVDELAGTEDRWVTQESGCHCFWTDDSPLSSAAARAFVDGRSAEDFAVMISARSGTTLDVRRNALAHVLGDA